VADLFRIETDRTHLSWSVGARSKLELQSIQPQGRLAVSLTNQEARIIEIWRAGLPDEVANNRDVQVGPCLYEETFYNLLLRSTDQQQVELRHRDPVILHGLNSSAGGSITHGTINFSSQIGRSRFSVYVDNKAEYDFEVEVFPSKLDYAADYQVLLADVQDILASMVLEYLRATFSLGLAVDSRNPSQLEWILLLKHVLSDLERAVRYIEQHPHQSLVRERTDTRVEKLRRPDAATAKAITQGKGQGPQSRTASGRVLHSRLPARRALITWDTPEHRWLASQLTNIRRTLAEIYSAERKSGAQHNPRGRTTLEEIANIETRITALQRLPPIAQTKGSVPAGFTSLTLQAQAGYIEAYRACLILQQGLRVDGGPVGLTLKEIHRLYEYWCYLTLVRLVATIIGQTIPVRELFVVQQNGLRVRLRRGTAQTVKFDNGGRSLEVTFNPQYKGEALILPQNPDIVLTFHYPDWSTMRLVFDAKYRIETKAGYVKQFGSPGPPQASIDALHRYRDAILEETGQKGPRSESVKRTVVEAVALFPWADVEDQFRASRLWSSLERVGIGAIPFLPRETRYLEEWLRTVLERGGWATTESTIPYACFEQLREWQQAEKEFVLVGTLGPKAREHFDRITSERCYYTDYVPSHARLFAARWIAIYSPQSIRKPAAVTHWATVEKTEIEEQHVVYTLGEIQELKRPVENPGPNSSFANNRWTTRLGIERAADFRELFLETSMEWRLHEQLRAAGVSFAIKPVATRLHHLTEYAGGRAWFVRKQIRVRYRGKAGFLIRRAGVRDEYRSDLAEVARLFSQS
jgi:predicted component of viral defense system (DUF524 family)